MKLGKFNFLFFFFLLIFFNKLFTEEKITTIPLVNLENLKPSFEKEDIENKNTLDNKQINIKEKADILIETKEIRINIVALDKITAKTSDLNILIGQTKKFGLLEEF